MEKHGLFPDFHICFQDLYSITIWNSQYMPWQFKFDLKVHWEIKVVLVSNFDLKKTFY